MRSIHPLQGAHVPPSFSSNQARTLLDTTTEGIFAIDEAGLCTMANRAAGELLGYAPDELLGRNMHDLIHHSRRDGVPFPVEECPISQAMSQNESRSVDDDTFWRKDGSPLSVAYTSAPVVDLDSVTGAVVSFHDIEERRVWERATKEAEDRTRLFLQDLPIGVFITDEKGRPIYSNRMGAELLGFPADPSLEGADLSQAYQVYVAGTNDLYDPALLPVARAIAGETVTVDDIEIHRPDGSIVPLEVWGRPIRDPEGTIRYASATFNDITERKRAEEERLHQQQLLSVIFETSPDIIAMITSDLELTYVNPAGRTILGYEFGELFGESSIHRVHPEDLDAVGPLLRAAVETGETTSSRLRVKNAADEWICLDMRIQAMGGIKDRAVIMARDTTAQAELEAGLKRARAAADEANVAKSDFLSRMSHELRTPLNAVLGFAQLLRMDATSPQEKEATGEILKAGQHLLDLVNEVLDIAAIEARRLTLSLEPVDVIAVARECLSLVTTLAAAEGITVRLDTDNLGTVQHVVADRQRLKQVLLNLIANGIKYNREDGCVTVAFSGGDDTRLGIQVSDSGRGIAPAKLPQLFVAFDRLGAEASGIEGTGLGLALAKSLVEAMGGTLLVKSELGEGTSFTVLLDRASESAGADQELSEIHPHRPGTAVSASRSKTVLYIEDNLSNIKLVSRLMARRPTVELLPATQGRLGLTLARKHRPDLILLDVNLPDISGLELLRRLKADPQTADVPVVMLSADATPGQISRLKDAGACDYLTKPIDIQRFYGVIDQTDPSLTAAGE